MLSIHRIFVTGVECDSFTGSATYGRVTSMYLSFSSLTGTLPSSIGNFGIVPPISLYSIDIRVILPKLPIEDDKVPVNDEEDKYIDVILP